MIKKEKECENIKKEIVTLRAEVNNLSKSSQVLEKLLNNQRSYSDKYILGYCWKIGGCD